jgi:hypothetical protein
VVAYPPYDAIPDERGDGIGPQALFGTAAGPCLLMGGEVLSRDGRRMASVATGETNWTCCLDEAVSYITPGLSFWMGGMEVVDGAKLPADWASEATEGMWAPTKTLWPVHPNGTGGIFPFHLQPRPIPLMYERDIAFQGEKPMRPYDTVPFTFADGPAAIPPNTNRAIELDVGVLTTAYVTLPVIGGKGAKIILRYAECYSGETLTDKGDRCDSINFTLAGHEDTYYPSGKKEEYNPFWFRTFRFVRIEVETGDESLVIEKPRLIETAYPLEVKSSFQSPNPDLSKLWEISIRTQQLCMHETYEDCPYYEQLQYTMDTRLQILFTYALSGDTRMALRTIEDYHASILPEGILQSRYPCQITQVIPVFALHWIFMLEDYYEQTGDASIPRRYRATVDNVLDWYARHVDNSGLVGRTAYWQFTDWVEKWEGQHGMSYASHAGPSTSNNLTYVLALRTAARLNRLTGRNDGAAEYDREAEAILANIEKHCWDEDAGLYREGPGMDEYGQHAQVLAVLTGLAKDGCALMEKTLEDESLLPCSFPWMFYFIRALEQVGMYDRTSVFFDRLTGFVKLNATTIPERHYGVRSECHAWGAFPLYEFTRSLLGVRPGAPGWAAIKIRPFFEITESCSGVVTTPTGDVEISWERIDGDIYLTGCAPSGVPCIVALPDGQVIDLPQGGNFNYVIGM